jgi:hypothetical protein
VAEKNAFKKNIFYYQGPIIFRNEKTRVRIPPGYKVLRKQQCCCVYKMTEYICIVCALKGEMKALATKIFKNFGF